jgi:very-short-patch-repair endonuclease
LVDLAAVVKPERLENAFEEAERIGELDIRALEEVCLRSRGKKGVKRVRALIAGRRMPDDTREGMEREFAARLRAAKLPVPLFNVLVENYLVDAFWPDYRLIAEIDSWAFHDKTRKSFEYERVRKNELKLAGYEVVEITSGQMPYAAEIIRAFLSKQAASGRAPASRA